MEVRINTDTKKIIVSDNGEKSELELYTNEAFELLSDLWLKVGWNQKYPYTFTWLGRPIIQIPEDIVRMQEVIFRVQPDVILETGVAHGGSLIFYASLCKAMDRGRVIGVDIEIRSHNRKAIEAHFLSPYITLIEGDSVTPEIVGKVKSQIKPNETVMVILDSAHHLQHVVAELEAYYDVVTPGSYLVATDGSMKDLFDVPRGAKEWITDNPSNAAIEFASSHPEFIIEQPEWLFNEGGLSKNITHWPDAWLKRI